MLYLKNNIEEDAYEKKYKECLDRANFLYPSDPIFAQMKEEGKKAISNKKAEKSGDNYMFTTLGIATFSSLALCIIGGLNNNWGFWMWTGYIVLALFIGELGGFAIGAILKKLYLKTNKALATAIITTAYIVLCAIPIVLPISSKIILDKKLEESNTLLDDGKADEAAILLSTVKLKKNYVSRFRSMQTRLIEYYAGNGDMEKAEHIFYSHRPKRPNNASCYSAYINSEAPINTVLKNGYIKIGNYDKAWIYHPLSRYTSDRNSGGEADEYYAFMTDVIKYLCKQGRKGEAIQFINEYSLWFEKYVDSSSYFRSEYWNGDLYTYRKAKARLLKSVNSY